MRQNDGMSSVASGPRRAPRASSRMILIVAAFGALEAVLTAASAPAMAAVAWASPIVYAFAAGFHFVLPLAAGMLLRSWAAIPLTSCVAAALAFPFSTLGFLLFPALALPTLAAGATVRLLGSQWTSRTRWALASTVGGLVAFLISLAVISPDLFSPLFLCAVLAARILSAVTAVVLAHLLVAGLKRAGIRSRA